MKAQPTAVIVGRPNVGKSSLFNRLIGRRVAIVDPTPGVTRDRIEGYVDWNGKRFCLVDTGGMDFDGTVRIKQEIHRQVDIALQQADVVLFLVDGSEGPQPLDGEIMKKLRPLGKPVLIVVNKVDNEKAELGSGIFYQLGVQKVYSVSALHGRGVGELLDALVSRLPDGSAAFPAAAVKIAILGKPNVGKSSFVNALLGQQRMVVDDSPGTTRDAVDVRIEHDGKPVVLIDTAGMKRSKQWVSAAEFYGTSRAQSSIRKADVVILMLDATQGISQQDRKLAALVQEEGKGMVLCLNKWDLVRGVDTKTYAKAFFEKIPFARHVPLIYVSALESNNVGTCVSEAIAVFGEAGRSIPTKALNKVFEALQKKQSHPMINGKRFKIFFVSQTGHYPPQITLFVNNKDLLRPTYLHYVEGKLREAFSFTGVPLRFAFRNRR